MVLLTRVVGHSELLFFLEQMERRLPHTFDSNCINSSRDTARPFKGGQTMTNLWDNKLMALSLISSCHQVDILLRELLC